LFDAPPVPSSSGVFPPPAKTWPPQGVTMTRSAPVPWITLLGILLSRPPVRFAAYWGWLAYVRRSSASIIVIVPWTFCVRIDVFTDW